MLAYGMGSVMDIDSSKLRPALFRILTAAWLVTGVLNGVHILAGGVTGWIPYQTKNLPGGEKVTLISRGMGEALDHLYLSLGRNSVKSGAPIPELFTKPYSSIRDFLFEKNHYVEYISMNPPYGRKAIDPLISCEYCLPGPKFTNVQARFIPGKSFFFKWEDKGFGEYNFFIRDKIYPRKVYFSTKTTELSATALNLPSDGSEITAEVRAWTKEGRPVRTLFDFVSLPETIFSKNAPIPLSINDESAPRLTGGIGYIVPGKEVKIGWTGIGAEKYEVSLSDERIQKRGSANRFILTTEETSATITGLPADCSYVYIHLEAYADNKWNRSSYLILSAPEEFKRNKNVCIPAEEP